MVQGLSVEKALIAAVNGFRHEMLPAAAGGAEVSATFAKLVDRGRPLLDGRHLRSDPRRLRWPPGSRPRALLQGILGALLGAAKGVFGLITATLAAGGVVIALTSHFGVTALVVGELFQLPPTAREGWLGDGGGVFEAAREVDRGQFSSR